jgi:pimeloyl-ACP methyl ester carboxylesterase
MNDRGLTRDGAVKAEGTAQTNGIETYYVQWGDGTPIVFIHGAIMDHRMWAPQMSGLSEEYSTVAYDVRGHGQTGESNRDSYSVELYVEDLNVLFEVLNIETPILCGLSMGGCIAQAFAAKYPNKVSGLALADTFTPGPMGMTGRLIFANLRVFAVLDRVIRYKKLNRLQTWIGQRLKPGVAGDSVTIQQLIDNGPTIPHNEFVKIVRSLVAFPMSDLDLSNIDCPTVVLYGENEPSFVHRQAQVIADAIPTASIREIRGAGHASNLDNPEEFTAAVRNLAQIVDGDG